ncbi:MAG: VCBS repeat-containing protein, partial [Verrucomicrobiota bacterium]
MRTDATRSGKVFLAGLCMAAVLAAPGLAVAEEATNTLPQIQAIYGGRVCAVNSIELTDQPNVSRVFAATESANSVFYGDVEHSLAVSYATNNFRFTVVPDFDAQANFGQVSGIAGHPASGRLFVVDDAGLFSCDPTAAGTRVTNIVGQVTQPDPPAPPVPSGPSFKSILIRDSTLLAIGNMGDSNQLFFGVIDAGGDFTQSSGSPITVGGAGGVNTRALLVHPTNQCVYIYDCDSTNGLIKSSGAFNVLSGATFSSVAVTNVISSWIGDKRFGIGPDGRLFIAGSSGGNKVCVYSDDDGASWTTVDTGKSGTTGGNLECAGDTNNYHVYFGTAVSTNKGVAGSWQIIAEFGTYETHANDGVVVADAIEPMIVYVTTDQGIGASTNGGHDLFEIDYGLEAVQIQDLDMNAAKTLAWTASKSGLRKGTGTPMALDWTPNGIFPTGDGAPFYSIAIDQQDTTGNTVYAGNCRIYKTTDGGTNWTRKWDIDGNTNGFQGGGYFSSLQAAGSIVVAGFYDQGTTRGGLLISSDSGTTWAQAMSEVDVNDVLLMSDGTLLVAVAYDLATGAGGVYQVTATDATRELTDAVGIRNLAEDSEGGVYASGQDSSYALKVYYRAASGVTWAEVATSGLPTTSQIVNGRGPVITVGEDSNTNDLPVMAVDVSLYYLPPGRSTWQTSSALTYPAGTQISVLYWDDLMVGTSEGLYGQAMGAELNASVDGDYDGDGKSDLAAYCAGYWSIYSLVNGIIAINAGEWGGANATPVPGDYDGDGKADLAFYRDGYWSIYSLANGLILANAGEWGGADCTPVPGDYDGDRKADLAVYRNGYWSIYSL